MLYKIKNRFRRFKDKITENLNPIIVQYNYKKVLERTRKKVSRGEKINVIFYTNEPQKWSYDSVYKEFEKSPYFSPLILVVPRYRVHIGKDKTRMSLEEQYNFYKERNYNVEYGYINGEYVDIKKFSPDVFFYLQLAEIPGVDNPFLISKYALTAYCPYAYQFSDYRKHYLQEFHKLLFVNYMEHELTLKRFESYKKGNSQNCISAGYPKLDVFFNTLINTYKTNKIWRNPDKIKIIYAPHHSFTNNKANVFRWGTFPENYKLILNLAKKHPETTWIFKPHPMLHSAILNEGLMTEEEIQNYYKEWDTVGRLYDSGDYFDIFKSSDAMITDCGSFLAEYLPTKKPLIRLINKDGIAFNELGELFSECFYNSHNNMDLHRIFDEVVINGNDYMKEKRCRMADTLIDPKETAAHKIYIDIKSRIIN